MGKGGGGGSSTTTKLGRWFVIWFRNLFKKGNQIGEATIFTLFLFLVYDLDDKNAWLFKSIVVNINFSASTFTYMIISIKFSY